MLASSLRLTVGRSPSTAARCVRSFGSTEGKVRNPLQPPALKRWDHEMGVGQGQRVLVAELERLFKQEQVITNPGVLLTHGTDESFHDSATVSPDVVFTPRSVEEVSRAMEIAKSVGSPVIPFGVGTSLEGHVAALTGGLCIDFSVHMNQIIEVNQEDMDCRVQAGCTRIALNDHLRSTGLFFPIDPGANATIGGMAATSASGTNAVRYGTMKQNVKGLTCIMEDGKVIRTGTRAKKSSSGFDLTSLFVGSEGTLGCISDVTLRLYSQPEAIASAVCSFETSKGAVDTVVTALQYGIPLAKAEFLDTLSVQAVLQRSKDLGELLSIGRPCLFLEFHGTEAAVKEQLEAVKSIAQENGNVGDFRMAHHEEDRNRLWKARHEAYYAAIGLRAGSRGCPTDVCVPLSRLSECIDITSADVLESGLTAPIFGHVGDGNFHVILLAKPNDESEEYFDRMFAFNDRLVARALDMGGTCTGEHGIGYGKRKWLAREHGESAVQVMHSIKKALDPDNRMNPGKAI